MKKRLFASLLVILMVLCLTPTKSQAYASSESKMQLGASGIRPEDEVYFGSYMGNVIPWIVLSSSTLSETSVASGTSVLPLFSRYLLGDIPFYILGGGYYSGSSLQEVMETLFQAFPEQDRNAVTDTTLIGNSMYLGESNLTSQKLFPLSLEETTDFDSSLNVGFDPEGVPNNWWLRTSTDIIDDYSISVVGNSIAAHVHCIYAARPALNLDQSSVIFISSTVGGKALSGTGLNAIKTGAVSRWKLTLYDKDRANFSIKTTKYETSSISIDYSGAKTGESEYLSAVIVDEGRIVYYGRLLQLDGTTHGSSGQVSIDIPSGITLDSNTTLRLFNEQYHSDASGDPVQTDYSSALKSATLPAEIPATGDSALPALWVGVALAAIIGLCGSAIISRRASRADQA